MLYKTKFNFLIKSSLHFKRAPLVSDHTFRGVRRVAGPPSPSFGAPPKKSGGLRKFAETQIPPDPVHFPTSPPHSGHGFQTGCAFLREPRFASKTKQTCEADGEDPAAIRHASEQRRAIQFGRLRNKAGEKGRPNRYPSRRAAGLEFPRRRPARFIPRLARLSVPVIKPGRG